MDYYSMAVQLFGTVPAGCEFIYIIIAFTLFLMTCFMIIFPALFVSRCIDK